jgi:hypothetical protein
VGSTISKDVYPFTCELVKFESERATRGSVVRIASPEWRAEIARVIEVLADLEREHRRAVETNRVEARLLVLTHEVAEKLSNILDKVYFAVWTHRLASVATWSASDRRKAEKRVVFPIYEPKGLRGAVGGPIDDVLQTSPELRGVLDDAQPYGPRGRWLAKLKHVARQKHMRLLPQQHREPSLGLYFTQAKMTLRKLRVLTGRIPGSLRVEVEGDAWDADGNEEPLHPDTIRIELWSSLIIEGIDDDALVFCRSSLERVSEVAAALAPWTTPS